MLIRHYHEQDWPRLCVIHDLARMDELRSAGLTAAFLPLEDVAESEGLFDYTVLVTEDAGVVQGFVAFSDDELSWLYVDPACRRRGIGAALVDAALASAPGPLSIEVLAGNAAAIAFYEAHGFGQARTVTGRMPGNESFEVTVHVLERTPVHP